MKGHAVQGTCIKLRYVWYWWSQNVFGFGESLLSGLLTTWLAYFLWVLSICLFSVASHAIMCHPLDQAHVANLLWTNTVFGIKIIKPTCVPQTRNVQAWLQIFSVPVSQPVVEVYLQWILFGCVCSQQKCLHQVVLTQEHHCSQDTVTGLQFLCPYSEIVLIKSVLIKSVLVSKHYHSWDTPQHPAINSCVWRADSCVWRAGYLLVTLC